tara:strand:+ start:806 stop:952 length:147 start_codon:yes stop_codon:yes gene_type:complete
MDYNIQEKSFLLENISFSKCKELINEYKKIEFVLVREDQKLIKYMSTG